MTLDYDHSIQAAEPPLDCNQSVETDKELEAILNVLIEIDEICFKSQQRGEADLTKIEKFKLGLDIFNKSKLQFLLRFGHYLTSDHLNYFRNICRDDDELTIVLNNLSKNINDKKSNHVKNRRYEALKQMISENSYFSEVEMMKRNPLLYEQLVGQYLSKDEIRQRDKNNIENQSSFVKILLEGIERNDAEEKRKNQEEMETDAMEESDSDTDDERSRSPFQTRKLWGEYENEGEIKKSKIEMKIQNITEQERKLLKDEFISTMYQSFLDGKDDDFDYSKVDSNSKFDNIEAIEHDEEDKYFDSEEPESALMHEDVSEDELDVYMSALNENKAVRQLAKDIENFKT